MISQIHLNGEHFRISAFLKSTVQIVFMKSCKSFKNSYRILKKIDKESNRILKILTENLAKSYQECYSTESYKELNRMLQNLTKNYTMNLTKSCKIVYIRLKKSSRILQRTLQNLTKLWNPANSYRESYKILQVSYRILLKSYLQSYRILQKSYLESCKLFLGILENLPRNLKNLAEFYKNLTWNPTESYEIKLGILQNLTHYSNIKVFPTLSGWC